MEQFELAEFAKNSENKEGPEFTPEVQEAGIEQGSLIVSRLYNTMLGSITRAMKSWSTEISKVITEAGLTPSALTDEQLYQAIITLINKNSYGCQLGDLVPNIGTTSPLGRVLCDGQRLRDCKTMFPDFYNYVINNTPYKTVAEFNSQVSLYGQCGFCAVEGNDVLVPLITRPISGVSNLNQTGQAVLDTMRPITGKVGGLNTWIAQGGTTDGAFFNDYEIRGGDVKGGGGRDYSYQASMNSGRLGARYNGTETRGKQVQYPYYIQIFSAASESLANTQELVNLVKYQAQLGIQQLPATSGTIQLVSGGIYSGSINGATTFVLPTPTDTSLLNQIFIQLTIQSGGSVTSWGTQSYFVEEPSDDEGSYNIIYEYDVLSSTWCVGQVIKVA